MELERNPFDWQASFAVNNRIGTQGACPESIMTNQRGLGCRGGGGAAFRVLWGEREPDSVTAEGEEREEEKKGCVSERCCRYS